MANQCEYCGKALLEQESIIDYVEMYPITFQSLVPDCDCYEELPIYRGRLQQLEAAQEKLNHCAIDLAIAQDEIRRLKIALESVT